jgi:hypothetical protein
MRGFETVSLLLNWVQLGALLAILFRLGRTFDLIANTQRELRRAIHHQGERRDADLGMNGALGGAGIASASGSSGARAAGPRRPGRHRREKSVTLTA